MFIPKPGFLDGTPVPSTPTGWSESVNEQLDLIVSVSIPNLKRALTLCAAAMEQCSESFEDLLHLEMDPSTSTPSESMSEDSSTATPPSTDPTLF